MITDESVLVTADCVVSEGEAEADNGSEEECHEHGLEAREGLVFSCCTLAIIRASLPFPAGQFL